MEETIFNTEIFMVGVKTVAMVLLVMMPYAVVLREEGFKKKGLFFVVETVSKIAVIYAGVFLASKGF